MRVVTESHQLAIIINRRAADVYAYASDPGHLPEWAAGLAGSIDFVDGQWIADTSMGRIFVVMVGQNEFGVLDHFVTLPDGHMVYNPMRVTSIGESSEVVFSLRRETGMSDDVFAADVAAVRSDLVSLKTILERQAHN
nr:SRPBCC family protein [Glaciihabitans sp. dw_435]